LAASAKGHAYALFLAPDNPARSLEVGGWNYQCETIRNKKRRYNFQVRAFI
jgi:hypothetical protein